MITGGQLVAYAVSAGLEDVNHGWRIIFALSLPFAILQFIGMHWFLPETPRFAVLTGDLDGARNTLRKIYPKATPDQLELKLQAIVYATEASVALKKIHPTLMGRLGAIFRTPKYFRCVLSAAVIFLGLFTLFLLLSSSSR
jgi:SP family myo-inositol transporter-like MFS transporter 13